MQLQRQRLNNVKTDVSLMIEILKPSSISQLCTASNLQELSLLLKNKNSKINSTAREKQNAQNWLNKEGINTDPLVEKIKNAREINVQKTELRKIEEDCFFYIPKMSHHKIDLYLEKDQQYSTLNLVQKCMQRDNYSNQIIKRMRSKQGTNGFGAKPQADRQLGVVTNIRTQVREQDKRNQYISCVASMLKNGLTRSQLASHICSTVNLKLWRIVSRHLNNSDKPESFRSEDRMTQLCLESLKLIEQDYDSNLSRSKENINLYLSQCYLEKLDRNEETFLRDRDHGAFWGKAFILYRAGRKSEFYSLLSSRHQNDFIKQFKIADQSIKRGNPKFSQTPPMSNGDIFRDQLLYALKADAKYSSETISDINSLDIVWILIRNIGIFYNEKGEIFQNFRKLVVESYEQRVMTSQQLFNILYLVCYEKLANMGINNIMDQDDYVHFLICCVENDILDCNTSNLRLRLAKQLISYVKELISQGRRQYIHYMTLIPNQHRATEISSLLASTNLVNSIDWQQLKVGIPSQQEFANLVSMTLEKYIAMTDDYISAAEKYSQVLNKQQDAVKYLLQYLIKSAYEGLYNGENILKAQSLCDRYIYRQKSLQDTYRKILTFLVASRSLVELLTQRNNQKIYQFIKGCEFISLGGEIRADKIKFLDTLIRLSSVGFEIYFKFIEYVLKGLDAYFHNAMKVDDLRRFLTLLGENLEAILSLENYKTLANRTEVKAVMASIMATKFQIC